ncbi:uncharacterized protein L203_101180 [Cryptococcus depauperatus CBS 7841]|uniref:Uncharacterized protein n=1 Tax=Cryptococcus depauperatus CBS 7841 TaxID=1295531 RepID=A0A1E3IKI7_9TREE|nr:hypothetical protein L203_02351 [Cryptococcus depauperatus CBS 7841]
MFKPHSPSDYPSFLLYVLDETHITVTLATATTVLYTHNAHVLWMAVGALGSSLAAKVLKKCIKGPRPPPPSDSAPSPVRPKKTYGMPSTHSTALSFYFFYTLPLLVVSQSAAKDSTSRIPYPWLVGPAVTVYWMMGLWSRKELGYHTWRQIFVGVVFGGVLAFTWRRIWESCSVGVYLQPLIDRIWSEVVGRGLYGH